LLFIRDPSFSNAKKRFAERVSKPGANLAWTAASAARFRLRYFSTKTSDLGDTAGATADIDSFMFLKNNGKKGPKKQFDEFVNFMICWVLDF
jgi:hypothetical protein